MSKKLTEWEKQKSTYFCTVTHDLNLAEDMKKIILDFPYWAWIQHDPDNEDGTDHVHFIVRNNGTRSVKQMADKLGIPSNFVQPCRKVVAYRRYLMHLDDPDKKQYSIDDVHTNDLASLQSAILGDDRKDVNSLFYDWERLSRSEITPAEFIQENFCDLQKLNFYQKIKTFEAISKSYGSAHGLT